MHVGFVVYAGEFDELCAVGGQLVDDIFRNRAEARPRAADGVAKIRLQRYGLPNPLP